ncbi:MAG: glycosyltransferase [Pseudomonadota bacterium]
MVALYASHGHVIPQPAEAELPQKIHDWPTPRIGGVAVFIGVAAAAVASDSFLTGQLLGICLIALGVGLWEDLTHRVSPTTRYVAALITGAAAFVLVNAQIVRLDIGWFDPLLRFWPVSLALTVFAIASFAHATNLTDGLHGLSAGLTSIALIAIAAVASKVGDAELAATCWILTGALFGFLAFNFPWGRIFLGDGGAYLSGSLLALLAILLVQRNPSVSAWFALLVLAHPVAETLLTVVRRVAVHQTPIGRPDRLHLHTLLYHSLLWMHPLETAAIRQRCNVSATAILLSINATMALVTVMHWQQRTWLITQFLAFAALFVLTWYSLIRRMQKSIPT